MIRSDLFCALQTFLYFYFKIIILTKIKLATDSKDSNLIILVQRLIIEYIKMEIMDIQTILDQKIIDFALRCFVIQIK